MTYAQFHFYFTIPLLALAVFLNRKNPWLYKGKSWLATLTLTFLAVSYTTPWDSYLIQSKIWDYPKNRVIATFLSIPFEEYFFFVIQTIIGCLITMYGLKLSKKSDSPYMPTTVEKTLVVVLTALGLLPFFYAYNFAFNENPYRYFFLIAGWSSPVVLLQWAIGYRILLRHKKQLLLTLGPLTVYFWFADWFAINQGIWFFPGEQTTGLFLFSNLPIEEALFFLMTNLMVIQGFILFTQFNKKELPLKMGGKVS